MKPPRTNEKTLRNAIVKVCHALAARFFVADTDGNISARLGADRILITPSCFSKADVRAEDLVVCDLDGKKIRGRGVPSIEVQLHLAAYRVRDDVQAVVHAHPPLATAFTLAGVEHLMREPLVPEVVVHFGPIPCVPYSAPGTRQLADDFAACAKECDLVLLSQHGAAALGPDPWSAYLRMEKLEHYALMLKTALELAGSARLKWLSAAQVAELRGGRGA
jgi:L-fuculose-phosphate aldolase